MSASNLIPDPPPRLRRESPALWALAALALALVAAHLVELWQLPVPPCTTRSLTGWPCPFCGSTRTLMAAARGELAAAVRLNPLIFLGAAAVLGWSVARAIERFTGRRFTAGLGEWLRRLRWGWLLAGALLVNWVYLAITLPK